MRLDDLAGDGQSEPGPLHARLNIHTRSSLTGADHEFFAELQIQARIGWVVQIRARE